MRLVVCCCTIRCGFVGRWEYNVRVPSSSDDNIQVDILPDMYSTTGRSNSKCRIYDSNRECDGDPCKWFPSSTKFDCERSATYKTNRTYDKQSCIRVKCTNSWYICDIYPISAKFNIRGSYIGSSSPPPSLPPPSPPPPSQQASCPTSSSECTSLCSDKGYTNGTSGSYSSSSGSSCRCITSGMNFVTPSCDAASADSSSQA